MRSLFNILFAILICAALGCSKSPHVWKGHDQPVTLDEVKFSPQKTVRWELPNGLVVHYLFDDELPLVQGEILLPGGSIFEGAGTPEGVANVTGGLLREGAYKGITPDELDTKLDSLGAVVESQFGDENGRVTFSTLQEDFETVFDIFSRIIQEPAFDARRLEIWKSLAIQGVLRRRDDPGTMAEIAFVKLVFGEHSDYSRLPSIASIKAMNRDQLVKFASRFIRPDGSILAMSGPLTVEQMKPIVEKHFGAWKRGTTPLPELPKLKEPISPGVYVIDREFDQATVLIGHRGPARLSPDHYNIVLFNRYFGAGGFDSLLFNEVRTRRGYAYDVSGGFAPGPEVGSMQISLGSRVSEVPKAIGAVFEQIQEVKKHEPELAQLNNHKESVQRSFAFNFTDTQMVVHRAALLELLHYPPDFNERYIERIQKVGPGDVKGVAERLIDESSLVTVVVGKLTKAQLEPYFPAGTKFYRLTFDTEPHLAGPLN